MDTDHLPTHCKTCGESDWAIRKDNGKRSCRSCRRINRAKRQANDPKGYALDRWKIAIYSKYRIREDEYYGMLMAQDHSCAICEETFTQSPHIDHSHATGDVRGLLCGGCNTGIGLLKDSPQTLTAAARYIQER